MKVDPGNGVNFLIMRTFQTLFILLALCGCGRRQPAPETVRPVKVVTASGAGVIDKDFAGMATPDDAVNLAFKLSGQVLDVPVSQGESVKKGALLAELDPTSARRTFEAAEAALNQAKDACERLRQLHDAESLPEIQWVEAQTRLRQAESAFGIARKNLEDCSLSAPFAGVVGRRQASAGENVLPGVPVMTLLRIGSVKVRFSVPEQEIAGLGAESRIGVVVAALGDRAFTAGRIEKSAVANPAAHTYDVRATLPNDGGELLPGMVCRVTVSPAGAAEEIVVPVRAVQQAGDGSRFVWTVRGDSAVRTAVTTGRLVNDGIVLTGGIAVGDRVVVDGMQKIGEGSKVTER